MRSERLLFACLLGTTLAAAPEALAEPRDRPAAEALFTKGRDAMERGDFPAACSMFEESFHLEAAPGTLLNLGICQERRGLVADAWESYRRVLQTLAAGDARRSMVEKLVAEVSPRVPTLAVRPKEGGIPGLRIERDGVELHPISFGEPLPINPGTHVLSIHADGREDRTQTVAVLERDRLMIELEAGPSRNAEPRVPAAVASSAPLPLASSAEPSSSSPPAVAPPRVASESSRALLGAGLLGAGGIGLALTIVTGALALHERNEVRAHCADDGTCDTTGLRAAGRYDSYVLVSAIAAGAAVVGIGVGTYVSLTASPGVGGVAVAGQF